MWDISRLYGSHSTDKPDNLHLLTEGFIQKSLGLQSRVFSKSNGNDVECCGNFPPFLRHSPFLPSQCFWFNERPSFVNKKVKLLGCDVTAMHCRHVCVALCRLATKQCDAACQERPIRPICCGPTVTSCQGHAASATTCSLLVAFETSCNFRDIVKHLYKQNFHPNSIPGHCVSNLM
jgi:hypothetical protein